MRKMHKKINIVLIFMLMSVFAALDAGYALRPPSQFNEQKPRQNHFEYIMKRLTSDRFSIIDDDRNHAAEKILKRFAEGYLPDIMPYQIQGIAEKVP